MRYISICSGIEAATVAWQPLGWHPQAFAEIDRFPSQVLKHHYPGIPNHGDFTTIQGDEYGAIDLLVGGTPCQDFSVAGLRAGMDGARGQLTIEFARLAERVRPRWLVWENVPGVLSIDGGRAFGTFLGLLGQLGYGFAYRVLDAQYFGVPQRRRRVFLVGHLGDWRRAAAVLFERHSLSGHPAPRREARQGAPTIPSRRTGGGGLGTDFDLDGGLHVCMSTGQAGAEIGIGIGTTLNCNHETPIVTAPLTGNPYADRASEESLLHVTHSLRADGFDASEDGTGRGTPLVPWLPQGYRVQRPDGVAVAFAAEPGMKQQTYLRNGMAVRRLTPRECERLQGFPTAVEIVEDKLSRDEIVALLLASGDIFTIPEEGRVFRMRGPGGVVLSPPAECEGTIVNGYRTAHLSARGVKKQIRINRLIWISVHGIPPSGMVVDHINSVKTDDRITNLQLLSQLANSRKAADDGLYRTSPTQKLDVELRMKLFHDYAASKGSYSELAAKYGITKGRVGQIVREYDYTKISDKTADGPRYKALGNSMAVPVMRWIAERIQAVENLQ